jgi:site-specific DNA-methyltransferase (adenine-specific)
LQERLIRATTKENDIVLDPAMGGGSVFQACLNSNRIFIGCDLLNSDNIYLQEPIENDVRKRVACV